jgi:hypothetical protein
VLLLRCPASCVGLPLHCHSQLQVRVWWPPTDDDDRTDFAGAYWPVSVLKILQTGYKVKYDNGEAENVKEEHVHPNDPPVEFGEEQILLQVRIKNDGSCFETAHGPIRAGSDRTCCARAQQAMRARAPRPIVRTTNSDIRALYKKQLHHGVSCTLLHKGAYLAGGRVRRSLQRQLIRSCRLAGTSRGGERPGLPGAQPSHVIDARHTASLLQVANSCVCHRYFCTQLSCPSQPCAL